MPTIDELAPAVAATDNDEFPVSQNSIVRKITRSQILAGVQTQIALPSGSLLGRSTSGVGAAESVSIGSFLSLSGGTLAGTAAPYLISGSPAGLTPSSNDVVPIGQNGINQAVSYSSFMRGMSSVGSIDGSRILVTLTGNTKTAILADLAASFLPGSGGTMSGPLTLSGDPVSALEASTKKYADTKISRAGDSLVGPIYLASDPISSLQAATKAYVDNLAAFPKLGFTMSGPITLATDPVLPLQPATKSYVDGRLLRSGDVMTGALNLSGDPTARLHAATKNYVDLQMFNALPLVGGVLSGSLILATDPLTALQAATKQYTDTKLSRSGDTVLGNLTLVADPTATLHAATKAYVDSQIQTTLPKSGGTLSGPLLLSGNPTASSQAATKAYVDTGLATTLPVTGGTVTGPISLTASPASFAHATNKQYVDTQTSLLLPISGGSLTGPVSLSTSPILPLHAATKQYVDANPGRDGVINVKLAPISAKLDGRSDDTAAFAAAYQLAPAGGTIYVPNGTTVLQPASSWGIPLTKRVKWIIDGTSLADGTALGDAIPDSSGNIINYLPAIVTGLGATGTILSAGTSQANDFAVLHTSYGVSHTGGGTQSIISNARHDTVISQSPSNHIWATVDQLVWNGIQTQSAANPSKHVGRYIRTVRQSAATDTAGTPLPQPMMWSAYVEYRDTTGKPSSSVNGSVALEVDWIGNGSDDASSRQIQSLVVGQNSTADSFVEVSTALGVTLAAGTTGKIYRVFNVNVPYSVAVLDTTAATQLPGAAAIRLAAGQTIAFESTNSVNLGYSASTGAIVAKYGATACAIGKGLSVAFGIVFSANATLPAASVGCIVFLVGNGTYSITLPPAGSMMAGTGFTFSALGAGTVSVIPGGGDTMELSPVTLHQFDRYHIVADGASLWREVFKTNSVAPRFSGAVILPSYSVAGLPQSANAGSKVFVANGRKPGESAGAGTGVEVFHDGVRWISVCSGLQVTA